MWTSSLAWFCEEHHTHNHVSSGVLGKNWFNNKNTEIILIPLYFAKTRKTVVWNSHSHLHPMRDTCLWAPRTTSFLTSNFFKIRTHVKFSSSLTSDLFQNTICQAKKDRNSKVKVKKIWQRDWRKTVQQSCWSISHRDLSSDILQHFPNTHISCHTSITTVHTCCKPFNYIHTARIKSSPKDRKKWKSMIV